MTAFCDIFELSIIDSAKDYKNKNSRILKIFSIKSLNNTIVKIISYFLRSNLTKLD